MALSKFNVQVDLGINGVQTGVSTEKVPAGGLMQLSNADLSVPGRIQKRRAFENSITNDTASSAYDKVYSLFSSDKECYRIMDNVSTVSGTLYNGDWFLSSTSHARRMRYGHRVLQKLTNPAAKSTLPYWTTLGAAATPIVVGTVNSSFISTNRAVGVGDAYNNNVFTSANFRQASSSFTSYSGRNYIGLAVLSQPDIAATNYALAFQVLDYDTNEPIARLSVAQGNYSKAYVTTVSSKDGRYLFFVYYDVTATTTYCRTFDCSTGAFLSTTVTLHVGATIYFGVDSTLTSLVFAYNPGAGAIVGIKKYTFAKASGASGAAPAADYAVTTATAVNNASAIAINAYPDYGNQEHCAIFWIDSDVPNYYIKARMFDGTLTAVAATTTIQTGAKATVTYITIVAKPISIPYNSGVATISGSKGQSLIYVDQQDVGGMAQYSINLSFFAESGGTMYGWYYDTIKHCTIASMPFSFGRYTTSGRTNYTGAIDDNYILVRRAPPAGTSGVDETSLYLMQTSLVIQTPKTNMDFYSRCVAKFDRIVSLNPFPSQEPQLTRIAVVGDINETVILPCPAYDVDCQFYKVQNNSSQLGEVIQDSYKEVMNGGYAQQIGTSYCMEREPVYVPSPPFLQNGGVGSMTALGVYQYCVVARIQYENGLIMRSAPSAPSTITLPGGVTAVSVSTYASISGVAVNDVNYSVIHEVYRTTAGGTTFYLDNSVSSEYPWYASNITSTQSDANLQTRPILYTNGGVIENITAPNIRSLTQFKGRIAAAVGQSEPCVWVSKEQSNSTTGQFTDAMKVSIPCKGLDVVAVRELDDKIIIFTQDSTYYFTGDGPNDTGTGGSFTLPAKISENVGCVNNKSIVRLENKLMFRGKEGFYFLYSNLQIEKISLPVNYFSTLGQYEITSCVQLDNRKQIQFYTSTGYRLVYFTDMGQWSIDNIGATLAAKWRDYVLIVRTTGTTYNNLEIIMEKPDDNPANWGYYDTTIGYYSLLIKTGWINFTGIQGFARAMKCILLGRAFNNGSLSVGFSYNYNPAIVDTVVLTIDSTNTTYINDTDLYLTQFPSVSATIPIFQRVIHMPRQKIEAVQLTIYEGSAIGKDYELNEISFEVGLKQGVMKLSEAQTS